MSYRQEIVESYIFWHVLYTACSLCEVHIWSMYRFANVFLHKVNEDIAPGYNSIVHRLVKRTHPFFLISRFFSFAVLVIG